MAAVSFICVLLLLFTQKTDGLTLDSATYTGSVDEDLPVGTPISVSISPASGNTGTIGYSLSGTTLFQVDPDNPIIRTAAVLDYETATSHGPFTLTAADDATSVSADVTVLVTDTNLLSPECHPQVYVASVAENSAAASSVAVLTCTDDDGDALSYRISSGDDANIKFTIPSSSVGHVVTSLIPLDFETKSSYKLEVTVSDDEHDTLVDVYVRVTAVNEYDPEWADWTPVYLGPSSAFTISEAASIGTVVVQVAATDEDSVATGDGILTYAITAANPPSGLSLFQVDSTSGEVMTVSALDVDGPSGVSQYDLTVRASDQSGKSNSRSMLVKINDVNDNTPQFDPSLMSRSVNEQEAVGMSVAKLTATDADATGNLLTFTIRSGDTDNFFRVNGDTLELNKIIVLDYPQSDPPTFTLEIEAADSGSPQQTSIATVIVKVNPTNDHAPIVDSILPSSLITISESQAVDSVLFTVNGIDYDYGDDGEVKYSISGGDTDGNFHIESDSGKITLQSTLDYEDLDNNPISLEITIRDNGFVSKSAETIIKVAVTDENDNPPSCNSAVSVVAVAEDVSIGEEILQLNCGDTDTSTTLSYTISSGNTNSMFTISTTGKITSVKTFDRDGLTPTVGFELVVTVSDGIHDTDVVVLVSITAVNEFPPEFNTPGPTFTKSEDLGIGNLIGSYLATDDDCEPHNTLTYAIKEVVEYPSSSTGLSDRFSIDTNSGSIALSRALDYEKVQRYAIVITAKDAGSLVATGTATLSILDTNDNSPTCQQSSFIALVDEHDSNLPKAIATLSCTDLDASPVNNEILYSFTQTPGVDYFAVNTNGIVYAKDELDYETSTKYEVIVEATDSLTTFSATVIVWVQPVNEGPPTFAGPFSVDVPENTDPGTLLVQITASDIDGPNHPHGRLSYVIIGGNIGSKFTVDAESGQIKTIGALDREVTDTYRLVIEAAEECGDNTATTTLTVNVIDENDNAPICTPDSISVSIDEEETVPKEITLISCVDADFQPTILYTITSGDTSKFSLDGPKIIMDVSPDWDNGDRQYEIKVSASDGLHESVFTASIQVNPVNEYQPSLPGTGTYNIRLPESTPSDSQVHQVTATDDDSPDSAHGKLIYTPLSGFSSLFSINTDDGVITLTSELDRETSSLHALKIAVSDSQYTATATVSILVLDVNDNAPQFLQSSYQATFPEDTSIGAPLITLSATDADDPSSNQNGVVSYLIADGDPDGIFTMGSDSGSITLAASLDYEATTEYKLTIKASDRNGGSGCLTSTVQLIVRVTNVNEDHPIFSPSSYQASIPEDTDIGSIIGQVTATDGDNGRDGDIIFTMPYSNRFQMEKLTGKVILINSLDYETEQSYSLNITASDFGNPPKLSWALFEINVYDVNDNSPECLTVVFVESVDEDTAPGATIVQLSCNDEDSGAAGTLQYTLVSVNGEAGTGQFSIDSNGLVSLTQALDYETTMRHDIIVAVSDMDNSADVISVSITVDVVNLNEHFPVFDNQPTSILIPEDSIVGSVIETIIANDADSNETLTYTLQSASKYVTIGSSSGEITLLSALDFEVTNRIEIAIVATDSAINGVVHSQSHSFDILVTDINDNAPLFTSDSYTIHLREDSNPGSPIIKVTADDIDSGVFGTVTYSIFHPNTPFTIEKDIATEEGSIILTDFVDYETLKQFEIQVRATDGGGLSSNATLYIFITGVNEFPPQFDPHSSITIDVHENATIGTEIGILPANDEDDGDDGVVKYMLVTPTRFFAISPSSSRVTLTSTLDAETNDAYELEIIVYDKGIPSMTSTGTVHVNVLDVNDVAPVCTPSVVTVTIPENSPQGLQITQLSCTDAESGSALMYGNDNTDFEIDSSGKITLSSLANFDYESSKSNQAIIVISDAGEPTLSTTATIYITVTGFNEYTPAFNSTSFQATVSEADIPGSVVTVLAAYDEDHGDDGSLVYSIMNGNTNSKFGINSNTGELYLLGQLDRETVEAYVMTVTATDKGTNPGQKSSSITVNIRVDDVNDNRPKCKSETLSASIMENLPPGSVIVQMECLDEDFGANGEVEYEIESGNHDSAFTIVNDGLVQVIKPGVFDAEAERTKILTIIAKDNGVPSLTSTATLSIHIMDINDNAPEFTENGKYSAYLSESSIIGTDIVTVSAVDPDISQSSISYSVINGNDNDDFYINAYSGVLQLKKELDRESTHTHTIEILAVDSVTPFMSSTATVEIAVEDANDNPPTFLDSSFLVSLAENTKRGTTLLTLSAEDFDEGENGEFHFALPNDDSILKVDSNTGLVRLKKNLDYETLATYYVEFLVIDHGTPSLNGSLTVTVNVEPVNEHRPIIGGAQISIDVTEDLKIGSVIMTFNASDKDAGLDGDIVWSISSDNMAFPISIDRNNGALFLSNALDYEDKASYVITVRASDKGIPSKYDEIDFTINVKDSNDNRPIFNPSVYAIIVMESVAVGTIIGKVTVDDGDSGENANYTVDIIQGDLENAFAADGDLIIVNKPLNVEEKSLYRLTLQATDSGSPSLSSEASMVINIQSENEFPPVFISDNASLIIPEDIPVGALIYNASANDKDIGPGGLLSYKIVSGNKKNVFAIDSTSGSLYVASPLDYDTAPNIYSLNITVWDSDMNKALHDFMELEIVLTDINDNPPVFTKSKYAASIPEDLGKGKSVVGVLANDADSDSNGDITYSIISGNDKEIFVISNDTGTIQLADTVDYETQSSYTLLVKAEDHGDVPRSSMCLVIIDLEDVNDNAPVFKPSDVHVDVTEESSNAVLVTEINVFDADSGMNAELDFTLTDTSTSDTYFTINKVTDTSAEIYTRVSLDRETLSKHILVIKASDSGDIKQYGSATVTVNVLDINDNPPLIQDTPYRTEISEDSPIGTTVVTISATDADDGYNEELQYSILSGDHGIFKILDTGVIRTTTDLDRETTSKYSLKVAVTEAAQPRRTATTSVSIAIADVNDNYPVFVRTSLKLFVQENVANDTWIGRVQATDDDTGVNAAVLYTFGQTIKGTPGHFRIDPASGDIYALTNKLDRETIDQYEMYVIAQDSGAPSLSTETTVSVTIIDHNDNVPTCNGDQIVTISENADIGSVIARINTTDKDIGDNSKLSFIVLDSDNHKTADTFNVDEVSGQLVLTQSLDRENTSRYEFRVQVDDGGTPQLSSHCNIVVKVSDYNDNAPIFKPSFYSVDVADTEENGYHIIQVTATDEDIGNNAVVQYELGDEYNEFHIGLYSGNITKALLDNFHPFKKYVLSVSAYDAGSPSLISEERATVRIDTFSPNSVIVIINLLMKLEDFDKSLQESLLDSLTNTIKSRHPLGIVKLWKIEARSSEVLRTTSTRRKLLQTGVVDYASAYVYGVRNGKTYTEEGATTGKSFIIVDDLLRVWQTDPDSKLPSSSLQGDQFSAFDVTSVEAYYTEDISWIHTTEGIVVLAVVCVIILLLIALVAIIAYRKYKIKKNAPQPIPRGRRSTVTFDSAANGVNKMNADRYYSSKSAWATRRSGAPPSYNEARLSRDLHEDWPSSSVNHH